MSGQVWWYGAQVHWTPGGHVMQVGHGIGERASMYWSEMLARWLQERYDGVTVGVQPQWHEEGTPGRTHQGVLTVTSPALLTLDAAVLRETINRLAVEAEQRFAEVLEQEMELAMEFVRILRDGPSVEENP